MKLSGGCSSFKSGQTFHSKCRHRSSHSASRLSIHRAEPILSWSPLAIVTPDTCNSPRCRAQKTAVKYVCLRPETSARARTSGSTAADTAETDRPQGHTSLIDVDYVGKDHGKSSQSQCREELEGTPTEGMRKFLEALHPRILTLYMFEAQIFT